MSYALIDCRMSYKCRESLKNLGLELIEIFMNPCLDKPVSAHPDIFVFNYKNTVIAEESCANTLKEQMFLRGNSVFQIIEGCKFNENTCYPHDCVLNFAVCGNYIIGNMKNINDKLSFFAKSVGLEFIDVKQGYSKCNICIVSDDAIITEDKGLALKCRENGIDVLLLKHNCVKLDGYDYGFIGGASGTVFDNKENKILFCGCIERHPEYDVIKEFCFNHGAVPFSLSDEDLYDYGSIIIL